VGGQGLLPLHLRAAAWYEQQGRPEAAIRHSLAADDLPRAARLIEQHVAEMQAHGRGMTVLDWLARLPDSLVRARPGLCLAKAWALHGVGQLDAVEPYLRSVEQILRPAEAGRSATDVDPAEAERMLGEAAVIRALIPQLKGDMPRAITLTRQALQRLPEDARHLRGTATFNLAEASYLQGDVRTAGRSYAQAVELSRGENDLMASIGLMRLAELHVLGGRLRQAAATYDEMQRLIPEPGGAPYIAGLVDYGLGDLLRERNELDAAARRLRRGLERGKRMVEPRLLLSGHVALARVLQAQGDGPAALDAIREALRVQQQYNVSWTWGLPPPAAFQARLWLVQGDVASAERWAREEALDATGEIPFRWEVAYLTLARLYLAQERADAALGLLGRLQAAAREGGRLGRVVEALALQALAFQAQEQPAEALDALAEALALAEPEGYVRLFVDEGNPMAHLLYRAVEKGIRPAYGGRLLAAFEVQTVDRSPEPGGESPLVEPLSQREIEVLQRIAEGLTNREIAQKLVIAPGTVKVHTSNIYGKLGVRSRTQAVARARALGILLPL
jgi:LuxR family maltose regulon positive regulatory protein